MNTNLTLTWTNGQYVLNSYYSDYNLNLTYSFDNLNELIKYFVKVYTPDKMLEDNIHCNGVKAMDKIVLQKIANDVLMISDYDCEIIDNSDAEIPEVTLLVKLNISDELYAFSIKIFYGTKIGNGIQYISKDDYNILLTD